MELKSKQFICTSPFKGKSKFDFWEKLQIGDFIQLSTTFKRTGYGSSGIYVPTIKIENLTRNIEFKDTINSMLNYISKIEIIEYEEK